MLTPNWLVIVLYLLGNVQFALDQNWYHFIPVFFVTSGLLVAKVLSGEPLFCRVLSWLPLRRLGTISYSFCTFLWRNSASGRSQLRSGMMFKAAAPAGPLEIGHQQR